METPNMKLYKAVTSDKLYEATQEGWQLVEGEPRTEKRFFTAEEEVPLSSEAYKSARERDHYARPTILRKRVEFGDVLIFVVWKDSDVASKEVELQHRLDEAWENARTARAEKDQAAAAMLKAQERATAIAKSLELAEARLRDEHTASQNLRVAKTRIEGDLAKARQQIGEKAWKEIFSPSEVKS
jgi:hypothetical protein